MAEPLQVEVTIAAPVGEVWRALREPARIRHWHGWELEEHGALEAEIDHIYQRNVVESEASHTLSLEGGDTFTLHDAGDGRTLVRLVRAPRGTNPDWDAYYDDISEGWITFLQQLRFALERHPDSPRRTVFLSGAAGSPLAAMGLPSDGEPGARYTATLAGEEVAGEIWFRSANQAGFTVDGWGDGLIITGKGLAVLTTYGQDDQAYQRFQARWTEWWAALPTPSEV